MHVRGRYTNGGWNRNAGASLYRSIDGFTNRQSSTASSSSVQWWPRPVPSRYVLGSDGRVRPWDVRLGSTLYAGVGGVSMHNPTPWWSDKEIPKGGWIRWQGHCWVKPNMPRSSWKSGKRSNWTMLITMVMVYTMVPQAQAQNEKGGTRVEDPPAWSHACPRRLSDHLSCDIEQLGEHTRNRYDAELIHGRDVYEFGVKNGKTLKRIKASFPARRFHGFDSFEGLPSVEDDSFQKAFDGSWKPGAYSVVKSKGATSVRAAMRSVHRFVGFDRTSLIPGFYEESLKHPALTKNMKPALFVHIDCDIYSSTREALTFLLQHQLITEGTLIRFDDWGVTPIGESGESKAWLELAEQFCISFTCLCANDLPSYGTVNGLILKVDGVGCSRTG